MLLRNEDGSVDLILGVEGFKAWNKMWEESFLYGNNPPVFPSYPNDFPHFDSTPQQTKQDKAIAAIRKLNNKTK